MRQLSSLFLAAIVAAATVGLAAQAQNSPPPQAPATSAQQPPATPAPQAPTASAQSTAKTVTFSGCIEKAAAAAGAAAPAAGAAQWVLTNASSAAAGAAVGTAGGAKPAARYRLDAEEAKISPHAGHKVEVTGTLEEASASAATSSASASASTAPTIKVSAVKMVAATCP